MREERPPATSKLKREGPLKPFPPTVALTIVVSPPCSTSSTVSVTATPMNSALLQAAISFAPWNSRPQSSTTPSGVNAARNAAVSPAFAAATIAATGAGSAALMRARG